MNASPASTSGRQILVLGTLARETALIPVQPPTPLDDPTAIVDDSHIKQFDWVGAPIIREMIVRALTGSSSPASPSALRIHPTDPTDGLSGSKSAPSELTTVFAEFQQRSDGKPSDKVWRVRHTYRAATDKFEEKAYHAALEKRIAECPSADIVVIYEQDAGFRSALRELAKVGPVDKSGQSGERFLVVALADKVEPVSIEAARTCFGSRQTIALVTADALRRKGLKIVAHGSIEQTVEDLSRNRTEAPLVDILKLCPHVVVLFEDSGAVYLNADEDRNGSVTFCPHFDRIAHMEPETFGRAPGRMAIALTAVTRLLTQRPQQPGTTADLDLTPALQLTVVAYNHMFDTGFGRDNPFERVKSAVSKKTLGELETLLQPLDANKQPRRALLVTSLSFPQRIGALKMWSRLTRFEERDNEFLETIVIKGVEEASRNQSPTAHGADWWPSPEIVCPFMQVGKLQTFDRQEIERLADLAMLMRKYLDDGAWSTPLSIGVFGPPGAGKSFAVKQLMKAVRPEMKDTSILTFNLAQFDSVDLLTEAFHQVQDQALSSDDVPLVIFDEFDSRSVGSDLGWLKYFLAPMEDGVFRGRTTNYKVGRAVFLFAGGTAESFDQFRRGVVLGAPTAPPPTQSPDDDKLESSVPRKNGGSSPVDESRAARAVKLPDFVSRLMAHLDVLGINPPKYNKSPETEADLIRRQVRRATLLRSILVESAKPIFGPGETARISREVIAAFLNTNVTYRNEARSMKALVRSSRWIGGAFLPASLPAKRLIELHTEGWRFDEVSANSSTPRE